MVSDTETLEKIVNNTVHGPLSSNDYNMYNHTACYRSISCAAGQECTLFSAKEPPPQTWKKDEPEL